MLTRQAFQKFSKGSFQSNGPKQKLNSLSQVTVWYVVSTLCPRLVRTASQYHQMSELTFQ